MWIENYKMLLKILKGTNNKEMGCYCFPFSRDLLTTIINNSIFGEEKQFEHLYENMKWLITFLILSGMGVKKMWPNMW